MVLPAHWSIAPVFSKATPTGGKYMNVGSGCIAEIVGETAETFDGNVSAAALKNGSVDWSRPTNN